MTDLLQLFTTLAAIPSPSGSEREVADRVSAWLRERGLEVEEDGAAAALGGDAGNLYCRLEPTAAGEPLFFCAHLDTVPPTGPIEPVVGEDGFVRNGAGTILGGDNKAAVVSMLGAVERLLEQGRPHAGVELVLTPMEEIGLRGAAAFDCSRLVARTGYVFDQAAPIGEVVLGAPYAASIHARFHGRASHAGMYPEEGRSAIAAAARGIADLRLGRVDEESTANVGVVSGGTAANIVPEWCEVTAEARSHDERKLSDLVQEMLDAFAFGANAGECELETHVRRSYRGYRFRRDEPAVRLAATALERCGAEVGYALSGGAADANVFNEQGLACVNLANGMVDIHTPDERIAVADLERMADVTVALCDAALA
ncbi:MAG: M20/M25/M40 family metallo-hydrolase [Gaiellaceae bacterium]